MFDRVRQAPNLWTPRSFVENISSCACQMKNGRWTAARPLGFDSLWSRLRLAWRVFVGRYDAMSWPELEADARR